MARRVNSDLLLVGSLRDSTEGALRAEMRVLWRSGVLAAGRRDRAAGGWVSFERERLIAPEPGHGRRVGRRGLPTGLPRHAYETPVFRVRPG